MTVGFQKLPLACSVALFFLAAEGRTQVTVPTFQGQLNDNGMLATGNCDIKPKLFDTAIVGTGMQIDSTITSSAVPLRSGVLTVPMDFNSNGFPRSEGVLAALGQSGSFDLSWYVIAGGGESGRAGEKEDIEGRNRAFLFERTYPYGSLPVDARRRAWESVAKATNRGALDYSNGFKIEQEQAQTWQSIGPQPTISVPRHVLLEGSFSGRINSIAISPADRNLLLIAGATGGVWRSTDAGTTFVPVTDDQVDIAVGSIAFSKSNPLIVYAGMGDLFSYLGTGVLKSTDAGLTWKRVSNFTLPTPGSTAKIEVDPIDPNRVYLAQSGIQDADGVHLDASGFWYSTDGGVNWVRTLSGNARSLVIHPTNRQILYLGMQYSFEPDSRPAGLFKSTDGGGSWSRIYSPPYDPYTVRDVKVAVSPARPETVYVFTGGTSGGAFSIRVEVSNNSGASWTNNGAAGVEPGQFGYDSYIFVDPANADIVYTGTGWVFKSTDGGINWKQWVGFPVVHGDQHALAFSPANSSVLYLGNDGGLWKTLDGGNSFSCLNSTLSLTQFYSLALDPIDSRYSYGGSQDNGSQVRLSSSQQWEQVLGGDGDLCVVDFLDPSTVFMTSNTLPMQRLRNHGETFDTTVATYDTFGEGTNRRIGYHPPFVGNEADATLYFGTWRLFVSSNLGDSWTAPSGTLDLTKGITSSGADTVSAIGVARSNTKVIYTGSAQGRAMVSNDGGLTWTDITKGLPNRFIKCIAIDRNNPALAYLSVSGFYTGHIFKTTNAGATWMDISGTLPDIPTNTLLIDPLSPSTIFAGTDIGVFRSTDGGSSWKPFNTGMPPAAVVAFAAQPTGLIQLATFGRGAYQLTPTATPGLVANVSTRLPVGKDDNALIQGFIVQGPAGSTKKIIVRALGPFLEAFGITDFLANPTLDIFDGNQMKVASNDNWKTTQVGGLITGDQFAEINASGLAPTKDLESAIIASLVPGQYTAVVRGSGNSVGTGLVDAFDISAASPAKLVNVGTRGLVQPGDGLLTAG
ncbi:MAG: hypothetical protein DLM73_01750, partial [Chthoniobacterales bacterium]